MTTQDQTRQNSRDYRAERTLKAISKLPFLRDPIDGKREEKTIRGALAFSIPLRAGNDSTKMEHGQCRPDQSADPPIGTCRA